MITTPRPTRQVVHQPTYEVVRRQATQSAESRMTPFRSSSVGGIEAAGCSSTATGHGLSSTVNVEIASDYGERSSCHRGGDKICDKPDTGSAQSPV